MKKTIAHDIFNIPVRPKKTNGKNKGNSNERDAAKAVSLWVGEKFVRVPGSGSLRWKDATNTAADIMCEVSDFYFPFVIETKHLKDLVVTEQLRTGSKVFSIWEQASRDAYRAKKLPMAMLRPNGMTKFKYGVEKYQDYYVVLDKRFGGLLVALKVPTSFQGTCDTRNFMLIGFKLSDLIARVPYKVLANIVETNNFVAKFIEYAKDNLSAG